MIENIETRVINTLKNFILNNDQEEIEMKLETELAELDINSVEFVKIVLLLEEEFNFEFDDAMLSQNNFMNINDIVNYIQNRVDDSHNI